MASVRQLTKPNREGKRPWVVEYTDATGKRRRATPPTGLKKDADKLRQKIEENINNGTHTPAGDTRSFRAVAELFIRHYEDRVKAGQTSRSRQELIASVVSKHLIGNLGARAYADLSFKDVEACHRTMREAGLSHLTARQYMLIGKQIDDFAMRRGYTKSSMFSVFTKELRGISKPKVRVFTVEDIRRILAAANVRLPRYRHHPFLLLRCTVHLAVFCGLRFGEIMGLTRENVDFVNGVIRVRHSLTKDDVLKAPKTAAGVRDVPLPHHVAYLIQNWMDVHRRQEPRGLIFRMLDGAMIEHTNHRDLWLGLLERAGVSCDVGADRDVFHFHALRHFNASLLVQMGMPVTDVAQMLGHEKFDTTLQTYAHPMVGAVRRHEAFEQMARLFQGVDATETRLIDLTP
ncbi:site-specific integrase [Methylobacterium terricola]|uniref:Site-specific integrase n=1 Tax=Methylobacterium terricola TaxID=2583531 RepID=A0A5C4L8U0_9HYPH|nr:site-specific integrase [Methylobacterium terricola]TNC07109.1 site-specific integrase [Methylobacterium terricola]